MNEVLHFLPAARRERQSICFHLALVTGFGSRFCRGQTQLSIMTPNHSFKPNKTLEHTSRGIEGAIVSGTGVSSC